MTMKLWRLSATDDEFDYDKEVDVVVLAASEEEARELAASPPPPLGDDPPYTHPFVLRAWWADPARSTCVEIPTDAPGIVFQHVHYG